jgi:hypothetical protein
MFIQFRDSLPMLRVVQTLLGVVQALLVAGLALGAARPADAPRELPVRVAELVRQLEAPQLVERNAAQDELVRLGPDVLPLLPQGDPSRPEVEWRLRAVRLALQQADAAASLEPSRVTLRGDALPLSKVLAAMSAQTQNRIVDARPGASGKTPITPEPTLKVDFAKTPFWQAMDQVLDQSGLALYPFGDDQTARIVEGGGVGAARRKWVSYSGPFRFEVASVAAQRDLRNPAGRVLRLEMEVAWEPRLRPIAFEHRLADVTAVDDRGRPLAVGSPQADLEVPVQRGPIAKTITISFSLPPRDAGQIARLHGTLHALVPGKMETFRFDGLEATNRQEKRVAGATVLLDPVRKGEHGWEVSIFVRFDRAQGALASHRNWILGNPAFLETRDGKRVLPGPPETTQRNANEVGIRYTFSPEGPIKDYAFVYQSPAMIFRSPLEYEIKDIPLP